MMENAIKHNYPFIEAVIKTNWGMQKKQWTVTSIQFFTFCLFDGVRGSFVLFDATICSA